MNIEKIMPAIEAMLFVSTQGLSISKISNVLDIDKKTTEKMLNLIVDKFSADSCGIQVVKLEDTYQMCTKPQHIEVLEKLFDDRRNTSLSQAAMEVLAIVAYNQPVTKSFIEQVRGVECSAVVNNLVSKDLLEEKGRLELPGRPLLYGTTPNFLRCFGISYINELPKVNSGKEECEI